MSVSVISLDSAIANSIGCTSTLTVQIGDLIVSGICGGFFDGFIPPWSYVCTDDAGNDYHLETSGAPALGQVSFAWAIAKTNAVINIWHRETQVQWHSQIVANLRWSDGAAPDLAEWANQITPVPYIPADAPTYPYGVETNHFSLADSYIITFACVAGSFGHPNINSDSGDSLYGIIGSSPAQRLAFFTRAATGPGVTKVRIKNSEMGGGQVAVIAGVFSRPLARPVGLLAQYQVRPGAGFSTSPGNEDAGQVIKEWLNVTNRPINLTLPYLPVVGSLVCIGVTQQAYSGAVPVVSDAYGNTYTRRGISTAVGAVLVALYTTIVEFLPAAGLPFIVTAHIAGPYTSDLYQATSIAAAEKVLIDQEATNFQFAGIASYAGTVVSNPLTVPAGSYLFAVAVYGIGHEGSVAWTALNGFTKRAESTYVQLVGQQTNAPRNAPSEIMDMVAGADGTYHAETRVTDSLGNAEAAGIALLGVTIEGVAPPPPPPPPPPSDSCQAIPFIIHKFRFRQRVVGEYIDGTATLNPSEYYESPEFSVAPGRVGELKDFIVDYDVSGPGGRVEIYSDLPGSGLIVRRTLAIPFQSRGVYVFPLESSLDTTSDFLPTGQMFKVRLYPPPGGILRLHGRAVFRARMIGTYFNGANGEVWQTQPLDLVGGMGIYRELAITAQTAGPMTFDVSTELPGRDMRLIASYTVNPAATTEGRVPAYFRLPGHTKGRLVRLLMRGAYITRLFEAKILARRLEVNGGGWDWVTLPVEPTPEAFNQIQMPVRDTPEAFEWIDVPVDVIE